MKKTYLAMSVLALAISGSVFAAPVDIGTGVVQFVGTVNSATCNINLSNDGSITGVNYVDLGVATINGVGAIQHFALKAESTGAQPGCDAILDNGDVAISWSGASLDAAGLVNTTGSATGTVAKLTAQAGAQSVNSTDHVTEHKGVDLKSTTGVVYDAQLMAGATPGTYKSSVAYTVNYN